jgi:ParB family transcriptional regulator, chromosome partitioning protein
MNNEIVKINIDKVIPNIYQPRKYFNEEAIEELSQSIKQHGIIQPLTVRKRGEVFELVAGERRLRAAKLADLETVP